MSVLNWNGMTLVPLACAAYNFMPNENSRELPFFLMFARDPILPLNTLLESKIRCMGNDINMIFSRGNKIYVRTGSSKAKECA